MITTFFHCADSNQITTLAPSNVTDDVATQTASVTEIVTADTLTEIQNVLGRIEGDVENQLGGSGLEGGRLTVMLDSNDTSEVFSVELSDSDPCTEGGTKILTGQLDYVHDNSLNAGAITGTFEITYTDCQDTVTLSPSDQDCGTTPTISGDMETTIAISYANSDTLESDGLDFFLESETNSAGAMDVSIGATASEQTYSYTHTLSDNTTDTDLDGTVKFGGQSYSVTDVSDFILTSTSAVVCTD